MTFAVNYVGHPFNSSIAENTGLFLSLRIGWGWGRHPVRSTYASAPPAQLRLSSTAAAAATARCACLGRRPASSRPCSSEAHRAPGRPRPQLTPRLPPVPFPQCGPADADGDGAVPAPERVCRHGAHPRGKPGLGATAVPAAAAQQRAWQVAHSRLGWGRACLAPRARCLRSIKQARVSLPCMLLTIDHGRLPPAAHQGAAGAAVRRRIRGVLAPRAPAASSLPRAHAPAQGESFLPPLAVAQVPAPLDLCSRDLCSALRGPWGRTQRAGPQRGPNGARHCATAPQTRLPPAAPPTAASLSLRPSRLPPPARPPARPAAPCRATSPTSQTSSDSASSQDPPCPAHCPRRPRRWGPARASACRARRAPPSGRERRARKRGRGTRSEAAFGRAAHGRVGDPARVGVSGRTWGWAMRGVWGENVVAAAEAVATWSGPRLQQELARLRSSRPRPSHTASRLPAHGAQPPAS
jgi:hypothetical protein